MKILVLDDDVLGGRGLRRALQLDGYEVSLHTRGETALRALDEEDIDGIISDIMMPEMSGMDFYLAVEEKDPSLARRFVFITGAVLDRAIAEWLPTQAQPVVEKPLKMEVLRSALRSVGVPSSCEFQAVSEVGGG